MPVEEYDCARMVGVFVQKAGWIVVIVVSILEMMKITAVNATTSAKKEVFVEMESVRKSVLLIRPQLVIKGVSN